MRSQDNLAHIHLESMYQALKANDLDAAQVFHDGIERLMDDMTPWHLRVRLKSLATRMHLNKQRVLNGLPPRPPSAGDRVINLTIIGGAIFLLYYFLSH